MAVQILNQILETNFKCSKRLYAFVPCLETIFFSLPTTVMIISRPTPNLVIAKSNLVLLLLLSEIS